MVTGSKHSSASDIELTDTGVVPLCAAWTTGFPVGALATAELAECMCPDVCERDHDTD